MTTQLESLLRTFTYDLDHRTAPWPISAYASNAYAIAARASLLRQFSDISEPPRLRMSSLGKPIIAQLMPVLGYAPESSTKSMQTRELFADGDHFEAWSYALLQGALEPYGYNVSNNPTIEYHGVVGHPDNVIVPSPEHGSPYVVIEVKNVNDYYFNKWVQNSPTNDRGYMHQLAMYMLYYETEEGYFLLRNSDKPKGSEDRYALVKFYTDTPLVTEFYDRVKRLAPRLTKVTDVEEMLDLAYEYDGSYAPNPVSAFLNYGAIEFATVPDTLRYTPNLHCFYDLEEMFGSKRLRVTGLKTKAQIINCLQEVKDGYSRQA